MRKDRTLLIGEDMVVHSASDRDAKNFKIYYNGEEVKDVIHIIRLPWKDD